MTVSESHGIFGVVHPRSQCSEKNSLQCGRFKTVSTASMARNSTRTAACLRGGCSPKIAGGNQKQWEPFRIKLFCLLCVDFHVIVHICKLLDIFFVTL